MITMTEAQHQELLQAFDATIATGLRAQQSTTAALAVMRIRIEAMGEATQRGRPLLLADFRNAVNALGHIDLDQMQALGFFVGTFNVESREGADEMIAAGAWKRWGSFRADPIAFLLGADDETQQKVWALVEQQLREVPK